MVLNALERVPQSQKIRQCLQTRMLESLRQHAAHDREKGASLSSK